MTQPQFAVEVSGLFVFVFMYLLTYVGGIGYLINYVQKNPAQAFLLGVAFLILHPLVMVGIGIIGNTLIPGLAERYTNDLRLRLSRYRKPYLNYISARTDYLDVKGMTTQGQYTLELKCVYVNLAVMRDTRYTKDPIAVPQELVEGEHRLWDYLNDSRLGSLVIVGPPGSGKTTLLRYAALTLCNRPARRREGAPNKLPIFLYLREHADRIVESPDISLSELVISTLKGVVVPPPGWFERQLNRGGCLIFLDGLDEVADVSTRRAVADWIEQQMAFYPRCRFVVSSRPGGYKTTQIAKVSVLQVQPFTQPQQAQFIIQWYMANEVMSAQKGAENLGIRLRAEEGAKNLIKRIINTSALSSLAVNPLLLTMIATVHRFRSELPGRRVELYAEICDVFLGKRHEAVGVEDGLTPAQKIAVLQPLAYHLMEMGERDIKRAEAIKVIAPTLERVTANSDPEAFLKMIEDGSGLLLERENGVYSFAHLTFQEFLAAEHVQRNRLEHDLMRHVGEGWWRETTRLYCARNDASNIILACLGLAEGSGGDITRSVEALALAVECLDEALEVEPSIRERIDAVTDQWLEDENAERRRIAAEVLLRLRLNRLTRVDDETFIDETGIADGFITHAEYQLFLDEMRAQGKFYQPDHWDGYNFPVGQGHTPVVGIRSGDAQKFCKWLTDRETDKSWDFTLPDPEYSNLQLHSNLGFWVNNGLIFPQRDQTLMDQDTLDSYLSKVHNYALKLSLACDLSRVRTRAHNRVQTRTLNFDLALTHISSHAVIPLYFRKQAPVLTREHVLSRARKLTNDLNLLNNNEDILSLDMTLDHDLGILLYQRHDLILSHEELHYCALILYDAYMIGAQALTRKGQPSRIIPRYIVGRLEWVSRQIKKTLSRSNVGPAKTDAEFMRNKAGAWIDVFLDLIIVEERRKGNLQAFEGLRIIKKRSSIESEDYYKAVETLLSKSKLAVFS